MVLSESKDYYVASKRLSRYSPVIENELMRVETSWCRMVYSDYESMLSPKAWHPVYEIHYVLTGSISFEMEDRTIKVQPGEFLVIPPKIAHITVDTEQHTQKLVFAFEIEAKNYYITHILKIIREDVKVYSIGDVLQPLINRMLTSAYESGVSSEAIIRSTRELILLEIFHVILPTQKDVVEKINVFESDRRINDILKYIRDHISENITAEDVSGHMHLCQRHLNRLTKTQTASTVTQLINVEKCAYIKRLLRSNISLQEVASMVNFSSEYTLNRFFKRQEGLSLGAWRKSVEK